MTPWGEIALLGLSMGVLTVLLRGAPGSLVQALARIAPIAAGLFLAGLGLGRLAGVPGFLPATGMPEYLMLGLGLVLWIGGLARLLTNARG
jgi:hypothetical protein